MVDANILLYAENSLAPLHHRARQFWDGRLSGIEPVCLSWDTLIAFLRISTNPRVFKHPLTMRDSATKVESWLNQPCVRLVFPTDNHWVILRELLVSSRALADLVPDAHLAALAIEHGCELYSTDSDFARFPKLKWKDPLKD